MKFVERWWRRGRLKTGRERGVVGGRRAGEKSMRPSEVKR